MASDDAVTSLDECLLLEDNANEIETENVDATKHSTSSSISISSSRILTDRNNNNNNNVVPGPAQRVNQQLHVHDI